MITFIAGLFVGVILSVGVLLWANKKDLDIDWEDWEGWGN